MGFCRATLMAACIAWRGDALQRFETQGDDPQRTSPMSALGGGSVRDRMPYRLALSRRTVSIRSSARPTRRWDI
jgi:hypothetical protein